MNEEEVKILLKTLNHENFRALCRDEVNGGDYFWWISNKLDIDYDADTLIEACEAFLSVQKNRKMTTKASDELFTEFENFAMREGYSSRPDCIWREIKKDFLKNGVYVEIEQSRCRVIELFGKNYGVAYDDCNMLDFKQAFYVKKWVKDADS